MDISGLTPQHKILVYDVDTRLIKYDYDTVDQDHIGMLQSLGLPFVVAKYPDGHAISDVFVDNDLRLQPLKEFDTTISKNTIDDNGTDEALIEIIPDGTSIYIDGQDVSQEICEGKLAVLSDEQGEYIIILNKVGFKPKKFILTVQ